VFLLDCLSKYYIFSHVSTSRAVASTRLTRRMLPGHFIFSAARSGALLIPRNCSTSTTAPRASSRRRYPPHNAPPVVAQRFPLGESDDLADFTPRLYDAKIRTETPF
jgi:hypothetical protein